MTIKLGDDVLSVLKRSEITDSNLVLPAGLGRELYLKVNKALEALGGKWNRKAKAHVFEVSGDEIKRLWGEAIETGKVVDKIKTYQFYETPEEVANTMITLVYIQPGDTVLEPSAGHGAILDVLKSRFPTLNVTAIEIDPEKCAVLEKKGYKPFCVDFVDNAGHLATQLSYDCIIANPPFTRKQDMLHILRMWNLLKPGGRLVSVAGAGVMTNTDKQSVKLQELVKKYGLFERLREKAFSEEGTNVGTCLVFLKKP